MSTGNIGKIKASRVNNVPNVESYLGEKGILFYNFANGVIRMSDGITPGGMPIPYNIASNTTIGGIKAGPGVNISNEGVLLIDTANLSLSFGNFTANNNVLTVVNNNQDMILQTQGNAEIQLIGNIGFYKADGLPPNVANRYFSALSDGQVKFVVPTIDPLIGAVEIIGSTSGNIYPVVNTGVMLHVTGQSSLPSRIYNDGNNEFAAFVGRRFNGNVVNPTAVLSGQDIMRISATGHNGTTIPGTASSRITFQAAENFTTSNFGGNLILSVVPVGSTTLAEKAWVTGTGFTVNGNISSGNLITTGTITSTGNVTGGNLSTTGSLSVTSNITAGNVNSYLNASAGTVSKAPLVFTAGPVLTTATPGTIEFDGNVFYGTPVDASRGLIPNEQWYVLGSDRTITYANTVAQSLFGLSPYLVANTKYWFRIKAYISRTTGDNNTSLNLAWGGNVGLARVAYAVQSKTGVIGTLGSENTVEYNTTSNFGSNVVVSATSNAPSSTTLIITGVIDTTTAGIITPLVTWSGATAAGTVTVTTGSNFTINPLGPTNGNLSIGNWVKS